MHIFLGTNIETSDGRVVVAPRADPVTYAVMQSVRATLRDFTSEPREKNDLPQNFVAGSVGPVSDGSDSWRSRTVQAWSGLVCQAGDVILLGAAFLSVLALQYFNRHGDLVGFLQMRLLARILLIAVMCMGTWHVLLVVIGVYSIRLARSIPEYVFRCAIAINCCAAVVGLIEVVLRERSSVWHTVGIYWVFSTMLFVLLRVGLLAFRRRPVQTANLPARRLIIVGNGQRAGQLYDEVRTHPEWAYIVVGFVGFELEERFLPASLHLGEVKELEIILAGNQADEVIVAIPMKSHNEIVGHSIAMCQMVGIPCQYFTEHFATLMNKKALSGF
jgi:FlaA1/EpsC-like NDP-sugar epimerase